MKRYISSLIARLTGRSVSRSFPETSNSVGEFLATYIGPLVLVGLFLVGVLLVLLEIEKYFGKRTRSKALDVFSGILLFTAIVGGIALYLFLVSKVRAEN